MRIGTICFATEQGIGRMARELVNRGLVTDVAVVAHGRHRTHWSWYPECLQVHDLGDRRLVEWAKKLDVLVCVETFFLWELVPLLRGCVRTVLIPMHECFPERYYRDESCWPDSYICVSDLDYDRFKFTDSAVRLPWPVDVQWRQRSTAECFVHNAGHGGLRGRNGTAELLEAWRLLRSPAKLVIRRQDAGYNSMERNAAGGTLEVRYGELPYEQLFADGDAFVFPEKFCGDSLPLAEARASGMLVMASDRYPMNTWLPREPLVAVQSTRRARIGPAYLEFDEAVVSPADIAARIDTWCGRSIVEYSLTGRAWAETMSWRVHNDAWRRAIQG